MISVQEAKTLLAGYIQPLPSVSIPIEQAVNHVAAKTVLAPIAVPSFDNSAMDGYAVAFEESRRRWEVVFEIPAGQVPTQSLLAGQAARIFTGAMIPSGADTVIPQELITIEDERYIVCSDEKFKKGMNVRLKGQQCQAGMPIVLQGTVINPGIAGLLASVGIRDISVNRQPVVAIITTGSELVALGQPLTEGKIYESNTYILTAYLRLLGIDPVEQRVVPDHPEKLMEAITELLNRCDVLIIAGGISVGDYDFVPSALEPLDFKTIFRKVKQKPGKHILVQQKDQQWIFGLPGNPVSTAMCFNQYVKPVLLAQAGHQNCFLPDLYLPLATNYSKPIDMTHFLKAKIVNDSVVILPHQESFNLLSFNDCTYIALLEERLAEFQAGERIALFRW